MNLKEISILALQSTNNLNTLNGVNQIQWSAGFQASVNSVYYEAQKYKSLENEIDQDGVLLLVHFCSDSQERISLSGDGKFPFLDGLHQGYQVVKDKINSFLA